MINHCVFAILLAVAAQTHSWIIDENVGLDGHHATGLSREQIEERMGKLFNIIDSNSDGSIELLELENFNRDKLQKVQSIQLEHELKMVDTNKDGFVDLQELSESFPADAGSQDSFMDGLSRRFNIADKDNDGKLSKDELSILLNPAHEQEMLNLEVKEIILTHDKNGDGLISLAEYSSSKPEGEDVQEFLDAEFKPFDLNNDGFLSEAELIAAFVEEAQDELETNIEDVHAILGSGPVDHATWMRHAMELSTSSITDHGELLRFPGDYNVDIDDDVRKRKEEDSINDYVGAEL